ncbi:MAG: alpha/beta hydrolase [Bacteroidia bacterium]
MKQILLLHGALGNQDQFKPLADLLKGRMEVYTMNFEGHGGRASVQPFSIDVFTQNLIDFLAEKALEHIAIFGYSMGGYVALNATRFIPEKIGKIITLGTKFDWSMETAQKEAAMLNPAKIEEKVPHFAQQLRESHQPLDWKTVVEKTASMMLGMAAGARLYDEDLQQIQHEVSIGLGSLDNMVTHAESEKVAGLLPNARLVSLEGVKHPLERVEPEVLAEYIMSNL